MNRAAGGLRLYQMGGWCSCLRFGDRGSRRWYPAGVCEYCGCGFEWVSEYFEWLGLSEY